MGRSYTSKGAPTPFEFDLDGEHFTGTGAVSLLDMSELAQLADVDASSAKGAAAIAEIFRGELGAEEYERFKKHTRSHHTDPDTLVEILHDMVEHVGQGNSKRSTSSSVGPLNTNGTSPDSLRSGGHELTAEEIERFRRVIDGQVSRISTG
jgi:hypothetical protein